MSVTTLCLIWAVIYLCSVQASVTIGTAQSISPTASPRFENGTSRNSALGAIITGTASRLTSTTSGNLSEANKCWSSWDAWSTSRSDCPVTTVATIPKTYTSRWTSVIYETYKLCDGHPRANVTGGDWVSVSTGLDIDGATTTYSETLPPNGIPVATSTTVMKTTTTFYETQCITTMPTPSCLINGDDCRSLFSMWTAGNFSRGRPQCTTNPVTDPCDDCVLYIPSVQLIYFPATMTGNFCGSNYTAVTRTHESNVSTPTTVVVSGMTYTPGFAYLSYAGVTASGPEGTCGTPKPAGILSLPTAQVYSYRGHNAAMQVMGDKHWPFDFGDLAPNPVPWDPWISQETCYTQQDYPQCQTITQEAYRPWLVYPEAFWKMESRWSKCASDIVGIMDPPSALPQATAIALPTMTAGNGGETTTSVAAPSSTLKSPLASKTSDILSGSTSSTLSSMSSSSVTAKDAGDPLASTVPASSSTDITAAFSKPSSPADDPGSVGSSIETSVSDTTASTGAGGTQDPSLSTSEGPTAVVLSILSAALATFDATTSLTVGTASGGDSAGSLTLQESTTQIATTLTTGSSGITALQTSDDVVLGSGTFSTGELYIIPGVQTSIASSNTMVDSTLVPLFGLPPSSVLPTVPLPSGPLPLDPLGTISQSATISTTSEAVSSVVLAAGSVIVTASPQYGVTGAAVLAGYILSAGSLAATVDSQVLSEGSNGLLHLQSQTSMLSTITRGSSSGDLVLAAGSVILTASALSGQTDVAVVEGATLSLGGDPVHMDGQVFTEASSGLTVIEPTAVSFSLVLSSSAPPQSSATGDLLAFGTVTITASNLPGRPNAMAVDGTTLTVGGSPAAAADGQQTLSLASGGLELLGPGTSMLLSTLVASQSLASSSSMQSAPALVTGNPSATSTIASVAGTAAKPTPSEGASAPLRPPEWIIVPLCCWLALSVA